MNLESSENKKQLKRAKYLFNCLSFMLGNIQAAFWTGAELEAWISEKYFGSKINDGLVC